MTAPVAGRLQRRTPAVPAQSLCITVRPSVPAARFCRPCPVYPYHFSVSPSLPQVLPVETFEAPSCTGRLVPVVAGGRTLRVTAATRREYVRQAIRYRLHEMDLQVCTNYQSDGSSCHDDGIFIPEKFDQ